MSFMQRCGINQVNNHYLGLQRPIGEYFLALRWCHNDHHGVLNRQPLDCLFSTLFKSTWKETSKVRVTGHLWVESTGNAENAPIPWRHNGSFWMTSSGQKGDLKSPTATEIMRNFVVMVIRLCFQLRSLANALRWPHFNSLLPSFMPFTTRNAAVDATWCKIQYWTQCNEWQDIPDG